MGYKNKEKRKKEKIVPSSNNNDATLGSSSSTQSIGEKQSQVTNPKPSPSARSLTQILRTNPNPANRAPLSVGQALIRESYYTCFREFYTLPESIEFLTTKHPSVTAEMVTKLYKEFLKAPNAEKYLRTSNYCSQVRQQQKAESEKRESNDSTQRGFESASTSTNDAATTSTSGSSSSSSSSRRGRKK